VLAELAVSDEAAFAALVLIAREAVPSVADGNASDSSQDAA